MPRPARHEPGQKDLSSLCLKTTILGIFGLVPRVGGPARSEYLRAPESPADSLQCGSSPLRMHSYWTAPSFHRLQSAREFHSEHRKERELPGHRHDCIATLRSAVFISIGSSGNRSCGRGTVFRGGGGRGTSGVGNAPGKRRSSERNRAGAWATDWGGRRRTCRDSGGRRGGRLGRGPRFPVGNRLGRQREWKPRQ